MKKHLYNLVFNFFFNIIFLQKICYFFNIILINKTTKKLKSKYIIYNKLGKMFNIYINKIKKYSKNNI